MKISKDIRLLASGPRTGLAELQLPAVQPGSSIMPGKVNPVLPEMLNMICYQVLGCDMTVVSAGSASQLELNVMMPVMAYNLLHCIQILSTGVRAFTDKCLVGMQADMERCEYYAEMSTSVATALNPLIGYDKAAEIAKKAYAENKPVREIARAEGIPDEQLAKYLNLRDLTGK
jgi:fumarate hydratase class II